MNIYLAGIIGTGKTTIGRAMAARLGWPFDDLDAAIEREAGKTIAKVVEDEGWLRYRHLEYQICKRYASQDRSVFGLGGGTPRYEWNWDALRDSGVRILLVADMQVIYERVRATRDRPRVNAGTSMEQDLYNIWEQYQDVYRAFGDIHYRTDEGKSVEQEVEELLRILEKNFIHNLETNVSCT